MMRRAAPGRPGRLRPVTRVGHPKEEEAGHPCPAVHSYDEEEPLWVLIFNRL